MPAEWLRHTGLLVLKLPRAAPAVPANYLHQSSPPFSVQWAGELGTYTVKSMDKAMPCPGQPAVTAAWQDGCTGCAGS